MNVLFRGSGGPVALAKVLSAKSATYVAREQRPHTQSQNEHGGGGDAAGDGGGDADVAFAEVLLWAGGGPVAFANVLFRGSGGPVALAKVLSAKSATYVAGGTP